MTTDQSNHRNQPDHQPDHQPRPVLVLGASGLTGSRVAAALAARRHPVRRGGRREASAFDWADRGTWDAALQGVGGVYVTYPVDLGLPAAADDVRALAAAAYRHGVDRLVLLSGIGQAEHAAAERAVQDSGVDWTILRSSWFAQNFTEGFLAGDVAAGAMRLPSGTARAPFVDLADVGELAAAALTEDGHAGEVYEVSGPQALTFEEAARVLSDALGRPIDFEAISPAAYADLLAGYGLDAELIAVIGEVFAEHRSGRVSEPTDGVLRGLGRRPRSFASFAASLPEPVHPAPGQATHAEISGAG